jgi:hypothetical protein
MDTAEQEHQAVRELVQVANGLLQKKSGMGGGMEAMMGMASKKQGAVTFWRNAFIPRHLEPHTALCVEALRWIDMRETDTMGVMGFSVLKAAQSQHRKDENEAVIEYVERIVDAMELQHVGVAGVAERVAHARQVLDSKTKATKKNYKKTILIMVFCMAMGIASLVFFSSGIFGGLVNDRLDSLRPNTDGISNAANAEWEKQCRGEPSLARSVCDLECQRYACDVLCTQSIQWGCDALKEFGKDGDRGGNAKGLAPPTIQ